MLGFTCKRRLVDAQQAGELALHPPIKKYLINLSTNIMLIKKYYVCQQISCLSTRITFINKYYVYRQSIFRKIGKPVRQRKPTMEMVDHTLPANTGLSETLKPDI